MNGVGANAFLVIQNMEAALPLGSVSQLLGCICSTFGIYHKVDRTAKRMREGKRKMRVGGGA